jgi:hypothetical protein
MVYHALTYRSSRQRHGNRNAKQQRHVPIASPAI